MNNKNITLYSDGEAERFFCYITDAIAGIFLILLHGEKGNAYNLFGINSRIKIKNLAKTLVDLYPEKNLKVVFKKRDDGQSYIPSPWHFLPDFDVSKLNSLGWSPKIGIKEGFKRTIQYFTIDNSESL